MACGVGAVDDSGVNSLLLVVGPSSVPISGPDEDSGVATGVGWDSSAGTGSDEGSWSVCDINESEVDSGVGVDGVSVSELIPAVPDDKSGVV